MEEIVTSFSAYLLLDTYGCILCRDFFCIQRPGDPLLGQMVTFSRTGIYGILFKHRAQSEKLSAETGVCCIEAEVKHWQNFEVVN